MCIYNILYRSFQRDLDKGTHGSKRVISFDTLGKIKDPSSSLCHLSSFKASTTLDSICFRSLSLCLLHGQRSSTRPDRMVLSNHNELPK